MIVFITKASNDFWHQFKNINTIEDLIQISENIAIEPNPYDIDDIENDDESPYWSVFTKEDCNLMRQAKYCVIIYDDYIE